MTDWQDTRLRRSHELSEQLANIQVGILEFEKRHEESLEFGIAPDLWALALAGAAVASFALKAALRGDGESSQLLFADAMVDAWEPFTLNHSSPKLSNSIIPAYITLKASLKAQQHGTSRKRIGHRALKRLDEYGEILDWGEYEKISSDIADASSFSIWPFSQNRGFWREIENFEYEEEYSGERMPHLARPDLGALQATVTLPREEWLMECEAAYSPAWPSNYINAHYPEPPQINAGPEEPDLSLPPVLQSPTTGYPRIDSNWPDGLSDDSWHRREAPELDPLPREDEHPTVEVWFGTNRVKALSINGDVTFKADVADEVSFGRYSVQIAEGHKFAGRTFYGWLSRFGFSRPGPKATVIGVHHCNSDTEFSSELSTWLAPKPSERRALVHIHGYATKFIDGILSAAQISYDLGYSGVTAHYGWPSLGVPTSYNRDAEASAASGDGLATLIEKITSSTGIKRVDILAHSMGNRVLLAALGSIKSSLQKTGASLGAVISAAADVNVNHFRQHSPLLTAVSSNSTVYVSSKDKALMLSRGLNYFQRVGLLPPTFTSPGVDTIDVSSVSLSTLGHGYHSNHEPVLYDMHDLLENGNTPANRMRLVRQIQGADAFWRMRP